MSIRPSARRQRRAVELELAELLSCSCDGGHARLRRGLLPFSFTLPTVAMPRFRTLSSTRRRSLTGQLEIFAGYAKIPGKQSLAGGRWVLAQSRRISKWQLNIDVGHGVIATHREYEVGQVALSGDGNATPPPRRGGSFLTSDQVTSDEGAKDR